MIVMSHHENMWRNAWLHEKYPSKMKRFLIIINYVQVESFRLKQPYSGDCVYTKLVHCAIVVCVFFPSSAGIEWHATLVYISSKCPKCTNLLSCPSLVTERRWRRRKKFVQSDRNGEWGDWRMSCAWCVCMHYELYPEPICFTRDQRSLQAKNGRMWIWTTVGICVKSMEHGYVTFWNVFGKLGWYLLFSFSRFLIN